jgi:hypothetical protein
MGESRYVFTIDHTEVVRIEGGATVTLASADADCLMVRNCVDVKVQPCQPYVINGIPPAPGAFNGQFIQMNVVSVKPAP